MKTTFCREATGAIFLSSLFLLAAHARAGADTNEPPAEWIDADTGHRVIRLSQEPGSESLYFNLNAFTPDGHKLIFTTPTGISAANLQTRAIEQVVSGRVRLLMVSHRTGRIFYSQDKSVFAVDADNKKPLEIAKVPANGSVITVNADETMLAGTIIEPGQEPPAPILQTNSRTGSKARNIDTRFNQHLTMDLFFLNLQTGEVKTFNRCNDWLNHLQFSPTDPGLLLFCHEGPWHKVDRIWTIRSDGTQLTKVHTRTIAMEIAGHEFWSADGQTIWYDLQTPRGQDFWVAGYNVVSGQRTWYHLQRNEWSVHFNISPDGKLFSGDGGSPGMVAHAVNGQWLYLFHPELLPDQTGTNLNQAGFIKPGVFHSERLVSMGKHNYTLEPNAVFTPDQKWLVFRSNLSGTNHVYAVELKKADAAETKSNQ